MMNKTIFLIFALTIIHALGQNCNNPLLVYFEIFSNPYPDWVFGANACLSSQSSPTCCSRAVIDSFVFKSHASIADLYTRVETRDEAILVARKSLIDLETTVTALRNSFINANPILDTWISTPPPYVSGSTIQQIRDFTDLFEGLLVKLFDEYETIRTGFDTYQINRATCTTKLLKVQAAAWCLACNPDYAVLGVDPNSPSINYSSYLEESLLDACYDYLSSSAEQNVILRINYYKDYFEDMIAAMTKIAATDVDGINEFLDAIAYPDTSIIATELPLSCTESSCNWISSDLIYAGKIDRDLLALAGNEMYSRRLEQNERRSLQSGAWNPSNDEAGFTIVFAVNPGNYFNLDDRATTTTPEP